MLTIQAHPRAVCLEEGSRYSLLTLGWDHLLRGNGECRECLHGVLTGWAVLAEIRARPKRTSDPLTPPEKMLMCC